VGSVTPALRCRTDPTSSENEKGHEIVPFLCTFGLEIEPALRAENQLRRDRDRLRLVLLRERPVLFRERVPVDRERLLLLRDRVLFRDRLLERDPVEPPALRFRVAAALRADAERAALLRLAEARPPRRPPFLAGPLLVFRPRPEPDLRPPPDIAFSVAQARRSASSRGTPRLS